jgi:hypothetical protein
MKKFVLAVLAAGFIVGSAASSDSQDYMTYMPRGVHDFAPGSLQALRAELQHLHDSWKRFVVLHKQFGAGPAELETFRQGYQRRVADYQRRIREKQGP